MTRSIAVWGAMVIASQVAASGKVLAQPVLENGIVRLTFDAARGTAALSGGKRVIVRGAVGAARLEIGGQSWTVSTSAPGRRAWRRLSVRDRIGGAQAIQMDIDAQQKAVSLSWRGRIYPGKRLAVFDLSLTNRGTAPIKVLGLQPLFVAAGAGGAAMVGSNPSSCRVLDNGHDIVDDADPRLVPGTQACSANWNSVIYDLASGRSLLGGFLTFERSFPMVLSRGMPRDSGFSTWGGACTYVTPRILAPGKSEQSEVFMVDGLAKTPFQALEEYGDTIARCLAIRPRSGVAPTGWNYWYSYGEKINENLFIKNLDFAARMFRDWGLEYFQVDDAWQVARGTWRADPRRFPHGMAWIARQIRRRGLEPGIWYAPCTAAAGSEIAVSHPDWLMPISPEGKEVVDHDLVLDVSNPEVVQWIRELTDRLVNRWGFRGWLKPDFTYYALLGARYRSNMTNVEAYRATLKAIRSVLPPGCVMSETSAKGLCYGLADCMRSSWDSWPGWWLREGEGEKAGTWVGAGGRGTVPALRATARRYWMQGRIWINHADAIQMRPPQTRNEAIVRLTGTALTGGVAKMGDAFIEMHPWQIDAYRKAIPVYPRAARPLDLFKSEVPMIWDLLVEKPWEKWHVVGLFNWGVDKDARGAEMMIVIRLGFDELGLDRRRAYHVFEFWSQKYLGLYRGSISVEVPPRTVRLLAIRENLGRPQVLSTDRHVTQGAILLRDVRWDASRMTLSGAANGIGGARHRITIWKPRGLQVAQASGGRTSVQGDVVSLTLQPARTGPVAWSVKFSKEGKTRYAR